jgi:glutamate synthase domain-containing protein 2
MNAVGVQACNIDSCPVGIATEKPYGGILP